ncbi:hypothetical protein B0T12DRAFT_398656 [Alternaria alternata]|nr:hypothetical protein B0T12DRAFT_398656 [Alternaria alternata]
MARLKGGRCQRLGPAPRRRNPGCMLMRQLMIDSCQIQAAAGGGLGDTSLFAEDAGAEDNCVTLRCMPRAAKQTTEASLFSCGGLADRPPPAFGRHWRRLGSEWLAWQSGDASHKAPLREDPVSGKQNIYDRLWVSRRDGRLVCSDTEARFVWIMVHRGS